MIYPIINTFKKNAGISYDREYSQYVILTLKITGDFEKGKFLREMKKELKDYEIKNYLENGEMTKITLVNKSKSLTERGTDREIAEIDALRMGKIIKRHKGLKLEQVLFDSVPIKIKKEISLK